VLLPAGLLFGRRFVVSSLLYVSALACKLFFIFLAFALCDGKNKNVLVNALA